MPSFVEELPEVEFEPYNRFSKKALEPRWSAKNADRYAIKSPEQANRGKLANNCGRYLYYSTKRRGSRVKPDRLLGPFGLFAKAWCAEKLHWFASSKAISRPHHNVSDIIQGLIKKCDELTLLEKGWDGEDALPIDTQTSRRAQKFLLSHISKALRRKRTIPLPKISGLPDGSIDLFWNTSQFRFLIHIPVEKSAATTFFGEYFEEYRLRGSIVPEGTCEVLIDSLVCE
ncbi:MAG: hypothetical protein LV481_11525 [Methylacidiphilales bacterium]|nr:hypothetical protein [Candidatus Methylacidiphilales bacterium]